MALSEKEHTPNAAFIAMAILATLDQVQSPRIEDISRKLADLADAGIDLGDLALRRVPGGFYSEDVENLVGHFLTAGYADQRSPLSIKPQGRQLLEEILVEELRRKRGHLEEAARRLKLELPSVSA